MATLTSIKNKYLTASDGAVLGVTTNTENISLLSFKLATADSLTKFNLVDGFADDYNDATGVDAGTSSDVKRDATSNYYVGFSSPSGGTVTTWSTYTVHSFLSSGTFILPASQIMVDCLVIGGGGGGGGVFVTPGGGGGGAGGWVYNSTYTMGAGSHTITIGTGGAGSTNADTKGVNGVDTTVGSLLTAKGGGGGGQYGGAGPDNKPGSDGGSGGGGSWTPGPGGSETQTGQPGDSGAPAGFGNDGGSGANEPAGKGGAGGGGAGAAGQDMQSGGGAGFGGVGKSTTMVDGSTDYFAGGGGGGEGDTGSSGGAGGNGGGGPGGTESGGAYNGIAGTANTGGGGGGGGTNSSGQDGYGGNGGSGAVYFRYTTAGSGGVADMTLQSDTFTAQTQPTTARIILDEATVGGTGVPDTDIKAYASRDGTNFTQTPLVSQGIIETVAPVIGGDDANTLMLLHMNGSNDGTTFTDDGTVAQTFTPTGAVTKTGVKKFGTASGYFDGNSCAGAPAGQYLTGTTATISGNDSYTVDFWMYPTNIACAQWQHMVGISDTAGNNNILGVALNASNELCANHYSNDFNSGFVCSGNVWQHIANVYDGTTEYLFVDGDLKDTRTGMATFTLDGTPVIIGAENWNSVGSYPYEGYLDEVRISNIARWTANFTPPVGPYDTGTAAAGYDRRLLSGSVDISGQPAGSNMKYKITTHNQVAGSKETRIYGTSMAWA